MNSNRKVHAKRKCLDTSNPSKTPSAKRKRLDKQSRVCVVCFESCKENIFPCTYEKCRCTISPIICDNCHQQTSKCPHCRGDKYTQMYTLKSPLDESLSSKDVTFLEKVYDFILRRIQNLTQHDQQLQTCMKKCAHIDTKIKQDFRGVREAVHAFVSVLENIQQCIESIVTVPSISDSSIDDLMTKMSLMQDHANDKLFAFLQAHSDYITFDTSTPYAMLCNAFSVLTLDAWSLISEAHTLIQ